MYSKMALDTKVLKKALPQGAAKEIASRCRVTTTTVSRVINGKSENAKVLNEIANYLLEQSRAKERVNKMAKKLATQ